jgi:hypothetical protein
MGSGASALRTSEESYLVVSARLYYVDGTFAWRSAEVLNGGKVVRYVRGKVSLFPKMSLEMLCTER